MLDNTEISLIGGLIHPKGVGAIVLDLEDDRVQIHNLTFKQVYFFPGAPKLLIVPHKWAQDRVEYKVRREGIYLKVMGKRSILVWNNGKSQRTILHDPGCTLPETSIN